VIGKFPEVEIDPHEEFNQFVVPHPEQVVGDGLKTLKFFWN
jgi:hypothetical protein